MRDGGMLRCILLQFLSFWTKTMFISSETLDIDMESMQCVPPRMSYMIQTNVSVTKETISLLTVTLVVMSYTTLWAGRNLTIDATMATGHFQCYFSIFTSVFLSFCFCHLLFPIELYKQLQSWIFYYTGQSSIYKQKNSTCQETSYAW